MVSKTLVNLASRSRDQEAEAAGPVTEIHEQVAGLLGSPRTIRRGSRTQDVHPPGSHLHDEQHIEASEEDRVDMEEIAGQQAIGLSAQERPVPLQNAVMVSDLGFIESFTRPGGTR
jgi:hypothetical protein